MAAQDSGHNMLEAQGSDLEDSGPEVLQAVDSEAVVREAVDSGLSVITGRLLLSDAFSRRHFKVYFV